MNDISSKKISFLQNYLDYLIDFLRKKLFFPVILVVVCIGTFFLIFKVGDYFSLSILQISMLAFFMPVGLIILKWQMLIKTVKEKAFQTKRFLYRKFRPFTVLGGAKQSSLLAKFVVNRNIIFLKNNREDQKDIVTRITKHLVNDERKTLFFIESPSGAGKTSTSMLLIDRILGSDNLCLLADQMIYYDLATEGASVSAFVELCSGNKARDVLFIIDNFHRIAPIDLKKFTNTVVDEVHGKLWKAIIVLTQPKEFISLGNGSSLRIMDKAINDDTYYKLSLFKTRDIKNIFSDTPSQAELCDKIENSLSDFGVSIDDPIRWIMHANLNRVFSMAGNNKGNMAQKTLYLEKTLVNSQQFSPNEIRLVKVLAAVSALTIHRGIFYKKEIDDAINAIAPSIFMLSFERIKLKSIFRKLRKQGFVIETIAQQRNFIFHETLAKYFKDHFFFKSDSFQASFKTVCSTLPDKNWFKKDSLMQWLYAVELGEFSLTHKIFPKAMGSGSFKIMLDALERNYDVFKQIDRDKIESIGFEVGTLSERVGEFAKARTELSTFLALRNEHEKDDLIAKAEISLIEAKHGEESKEILLQILNSLNVSKLTKLIAKYWIIHLDAHRGIFRENDLIEILDEINNNWEILEDCDSYSLLHIARRAYFDSARFFFLAGSGDLKKLNFLSNHGIASRLRDKHIEFNAFFEKFFVAHVIHYEVIFVKGIFKKIPEDVSESILSNEELQLNIESIISLAKHSYKTSMNEFSVFGDKTSEYIKPRICELEMMTTNHGELLEKLNFYENFIIKTGLEDLYPYPNMYFFKYFYIISFEVIIKSEMHLELNDQYLKFQEHDVYIHKSLNYLDKAMNAYKKIGNEYGVATCKLFKLIAEFSEVVKTVNFEKKIEALGDEFCKRNYYMHKRLIDHLIYDENFNLSPQKKLDIIKYFPLVLQ